MILWKNTGDEFSHVDPLWDGFPVAILGGGPHLTLDQVALIKQARPHIKCIAVNDTYLLAPWADVCYFADSEWWKWHSEGHAKSLLALSADEVRERFAGFKGQKCSIQYAGSNIRDPAVHVLRNKTHPYQGSGLSLDPGSIGTGRNSGFQAMNIAVLAGSKKILLLGFDAARSADGLAHWFGDHPRVTPTEPLYDAMRRSFSGIERDLVSIGVKVINCNVRSSLDSFNKMPLQEALL